MTVHPAYYFGALSYCCEFDDGAVILELGTGTYLGIHAGIPAHLQQRIRNWPDSRKSTAA